MRAGGWVLLEFAKWRYGGSEPAVTPKLSPQARKPGRVRDRPGCVRIDAGGGQPGRPEGCRRITWLRRNQRVDGSWPARVDQPGTATGSFAEPFMSDAATAWAVLALLKAENHAKE